MYNVKISARRSPTDGAPAKVGRRIRLQVRTSWSSPARFSNYFFKPDEIASQMYCICSHSRFFAFFIAGRSTPERKYTWKKFITTRSNSTDLPTSRRYSPTAGSGNMSHHATLAINTSSIPSSETTPRHQHSSSAASSDTEYTTLDTHDLWLPDYEPTPSTLSALHQFGKEMLRLSSGLQNVDLSGSEFSHTYQGWVKNEEEGGIGSDRDLRFLIEPLMLDFRLRSKYWWKN